MGFLESFALTDNPFGPKSALTGMKVKKLMKSLEAFPLFVHKEPLLDPLYCETAGPFGDHERTFKKLLEQSGYKLNPASRGVLAMTVVIRGDQGSGKTTLASRMMEVLMKHTPAGEPSWKPFETSLTADRLAPSAQVERLRAQKETIEKESQDNDYCCVLIDDLGAGALNEALDLRNELEDESDRVVFSFITTRDQKLLTKEFQQRMHSTAVTVFDTREITPDEAVAFAQHRIGYYRPDPQQPIPEGDIFPFTVPDIRQAVSLGKFAPVPAGGVVAGSGPINLRLVNLTLNAALVNGEKPAEQGFDVRKLQEKELPQYRIRIAEAYKRLVST